MLHRFAKDFELSDDAVLNQRTTAERLLIDAASIFLDACDGVEDMPQVDAFIALHRSSELRPISFLANRD